MGTYLALRDLKPDLILSSAALRGQLTADLLAQNIAYEGRIDYLKELYLTKAEMIINVLSLQDDENDTIFVIGHNPALSELANMLQQENFTKFPTLGVLALNLDIDSWQEINEHSHAQIDHFIFPKQLKYYLPKQIRAILK